MNKNIGKVKISEVIAELGLPQDSKYLGYAIHRPDTDEYLAASVDRKDGSSWAWVPTPQLAYKYDDYKQVLSVTAKYEKAPVLVGLVFDTGNTVMFVSSTEQILH